MFLFGLAILAAGCSKTEPPPPPPPPSTGSNITVIQDEFEGTDIVLAGSPTLNFIVSYNREINGTLLNFSSVNGDLPVIMEDDEGNRWDIFGRAVSGPRSGEFLEILNSSMGYWFSFAAMYAVVEIFSGPSSSINFVLPDPASNWLIPTQTVFQGAGFDAIQSHDTPQFITYDSRDYLENPFYVAPENLIIGVDVAGSRKAYPHALLDYHEIINDDLNGEFIAVIYCPLTGTAKVWNRDLASGLTTFGVSGLLYNSNILAFNRTSNGLWTQLDGVCVNGDLIGTNAEQFRHVETSLSTWEKMYPTPLVASDETGQDRDYGEYPYGDYITNHDFISYPIAFEDARIPSKERVHAVVKDGKARIYRFSDF